MGIYISTLFALRRWKPVLQFHGLDVPVTGPHVTRPVWKHIWKGDYEAPEIKALSSVIRDHDIVLEMGTGMGVVSGLTAKANPTVTVHAFEANPAMIPVITDLHKRNAITNVTVHNAILLPDASEGETRALHLHQNFSESSITDQIDSAGSVAVPVKDMHRVLADLKPDVLVCDIEGAEAEVFVDLDLSCLRALVIELHPHIVNEAQITRIYDLCAQFDLFPNASLSSGTVVAFERRVL